ncbi:hypothetical protein [Helicobacter sp. T3_23-1059]
MKECFIKRLVSILSLSVFLGFSGLSASVDSAESKFIQEDSNFLFGTEVTKLNVQILSKQELEEVKGEFCPILLTGLGIGAISWIVDGSFEPYFEFGNK